MDSVVTTLIFYIGYNNFKLFFPESPVIPMKVGQFFILLSLNPQDWGH